MSMWPSLLELNAISLPVGDQTGQRSVWGENVNRVFVPRVASRIQMPRSPSSPIKLKATLHPSGERDMVSMGSGGPTGEILLPLRSCQASCIRAHESSAQ